MLSGIVYDAFKTTYMRNIVGEGYDICFPHEKNPYKKSQLQQAIRIILNTPREEGGYLDFMRHCNPWKEGEDAIIEKTPEALAECERCIDEVTSELISLSKCKGEGQLYLSVLNLGNTAGMKQEIDTAREDLEVIKKRYDEAVDRGASEESLTYLDNEVEIQTRKLSNLRKWMHKRMKDVKVVKHEVAKRRGIEIGKYNNIFHEQSVRNHRKGAFSPHGHRDYKRDEAKRLLILRKHVNQELANDVDIPQDVLDSVYYRTKRKRASAPTPHDQSKKARA